MRVIKARRYLPNVMARFCTVQLKVRRIHAYLESMGWDEWDSAIGLRADEPRRAAKMLSGKSNESTKENPILPLFHEGVTKETIFDFWTAQDFDLQLPNNNGVTDWGNCDLCFLKGYSKRLSIIRERPQLADWWMEQEQMVGGRFRKDTPDYRQMQVIATDNQLFDFGDDETIPCFCGD